MPEPAGGKGKPMETVEKRRCWTLAGMMLLIAAIAILLLFPAAVLRQRQLAARIAAERARALAAERDAWLHHRAAVQAAEQTRTTAELQAIQANEKAQRETDQLRRENEELRQRIAELERRLGEPQTRP
jgi:nucleotide-binding universal stress UspA family protein